MLVRISLVTLLLGALSLAKQPNIVFFFVDDMGWQDTSVPFYSEKTPLNELYKTPNMEALAKDGMLFTDAYACAICSPSRVSLMTGMNAARHRVTNWTLVKNGGKDGILSKKKLIQVPNWNVNGLQPIGSGIERAVEATTLPTLLRDSGYRTIHVGKAHFGAAKTPGENPANLGFDINIAGHAAGGPGSYYASNNFSALFRRGSPIWNVPGLENYHGTDLHLDEVLTIEANKAVDQAVADKKPFYLYMSHYAVHAPFEPNLKLIQKYRKLGLNKHAATYASMIESMDTSLGSILENLKKHNIEDDTIIVFMSDNGSPASNPQNKPLQGAKISCYEGGTRVPMIVKWPGVTKPGSRNSQYLIIEDIFPSFLEMAGVEYAGTESQVIDGVSFVPLLKDLSLQTRDRSIFWHYPNTYHQEPYSSIRKGDWKLIYKYYGQKFELYNLKEDIGEANNLASQQPAKLKELASGLGDFLRSTKAQRPRVYGSKVEIPYPDEVVNRIP